MQYFPAHRVSDIRVSYIVFAGISETDSLGKKAGAGIAICWLLTMSFTVEAFAHTTELGKSRICVQFNQRPDASLIAVLKSAEVNARYRKGVKKGNCPLWYIPATAIDTLSEKLGETTQLPGGQIDKLSQAIAPYVTQEPSASEDEVGDGDAQSDGDSSQPLSAMSLPPRKRLRTRLPCQACEYERRATLLGHGFGQMYHSCCESQE